MNSNIININTNNNIYNNTNNNLHNNNNNIRNNNININIFRNNNNNIHNDNNIIRNNNINIKIIRNNNNNINNNIIRNNINNINNNIIRNNNNINSNNNFNTNRNNNNNTNRNNSNNISNYNIRDNNKRPNLREIENSIMTSVNLSNLSDFEKKKLELTLEMDEYQYKHIQKYESRKKKECAICLEKFLGTDIIKAFYKCVHIFHKKCLLNWLKKNNKCPLCKHDLSDDIKNMK